MSIKELKELTLEKLNKMYGEDLADLCSQIWDKKYYYNGYTDELFQEDEDDIYPVNYAGLGDEILKRIKELENEKH